MDEAEFNEFLERYYEAPDPNRALEGLRYYMAQTREPDAGEVVVLSYFFGRLAQLHPEISDTFREIIDASEDAKPEFCAELAKWLGDTETAPTNALNRVIQSPQDNDLHWVEFCVTGKSEPIVRLIDLFGRADKVRGKLEDWLSEPEPFLSRWFKRRQRACEALYREIDLHIDSDAGTILSTDDLDALCFMRGDRVIEKQEFDQMSAFLPISLTVEEVNHCVTKATAKWSLCSNAIRMDRVRAIVVEEIDQRDGPILTTLLEIAARAHIATDDATAAKRFLDLYLDRNPSRLQLQALRMPFLAEAEIASRAELTEDAIEVSGSVSNAEIKTAVSRCLSNEQSVKSRYGKLTTGIRKGDDFESCEDQNYIEWTYKFDGQGSIEVVQWMDPDDWDVWICIENKTYQSAGIWYEVSDRAQIRSHAYVNSLLRNAGWPDVLKKDNPVSSDIFEWNGGRYLKLCYSSVLIQKVIARILPIQKAIMGGAAEVEIWIDLKSGWMVACGATIKNVMLHEKTVHFYLHHFFALPNSPVAIKQPEVMVAPPGWDIEPGTTMKVHSMGSASKLFDPE